MIYLKNYSHLKIQATQNIMLMTLLLWQAGPDFGSQEMCVYFLNISIKVAQTRKRY